MEYKDYYKILGLERTAAQDEIKRTYRKLARKYHPDINKDLNAEAKFKEVSEAYTVLGDVEKRAAYDQLGLEHAAGQEFRPPPNWDSGFEFSGSGLGGQPGDASDFFEALFGGRRGHQPQSRRREEFHARGEDHHAKVQIDLRDTFEGATRAIALRVPELDAHGHVALRERTLSVKIPKGVVEGQHIRLKGQGMPGLGQVTAGDLYLEIQFKPDSAFRASGRDIYTDLRVAPWEAALGAEIDTPTPSGTIKLKVPPGSSQGRRLRVKGRGIPAAEPGDLYVVITLVLPPATSDKARRLYEEMAKELAFDPRAASGA